MEARQGSWLCPTENDRQRVLDTSDRVRRARLAGSAVIGVALVGLAPMLGWWLLGLFALSCLNLLTLDRRMARVARPEWVVARGLLVTELILAAAAAGTGGPLSPLLPWLVIPIGLMSARFRGRVVAAGTAIGAGLVAAMVVLVDPRGFVDHPALAVATLALLGNVAAITGALRGAELQHRSEAVLDPLTGLLNRKALRVRFAELAAQARLQDAPVCAIALDLDHFKAINDEHGHEAGDAVLRDVAYAMRKVLRSFELMYRLGGEEFLVLLPGVHVAEGEAVAERLRAAVASARPGGLSTTLSAGVAAARGDAVEYDSLFAAADAALYRAKGEGRNRVVCAAGSEPVPIVSGLASGAALV
ncbi:MAG: two-component system, cell cycle response regulator [Solirubrobacteraceae bacterium]|jgi:diguanylate cyclase (GGDEF)-like protein|nr:two-component system, cell cycle response regulator [Solirubrobacteraceae bacterium]